MSIDRRISETVRYWLLAKQNSSRYQRSNVTTMLEPAFSLSLSVSLSLCVSVGVVVCDRMSVCEQDKSKTCGRNFYEISKWIAVAQGRYG